MTRPTFRCPEQELLFLLVRVNPPKPESSRILDLLSCDLNWALFFSLASHHRITGLALKQLSEYNDHLPEDLVSDIKHRMLMNIRRSMSKQYALTQVISILQEADIQGIPLKGLGLSLQLYNDPYARSGVDIDILISPSDLKRAHSLLLRKGFSLESPAGAITPARLAYLSRYEHSYNYYHPDYKFDLDFHWQLNEVPAMPASLFFENTEDKPLILGSCKFPAVKPEAYLVFLIKHGFRDQWCHLKTLSDFSNFFRISDHTINNTRLIKLVKQYELGRPLKQALILSEQYLGLCVPDELNTYIDSIKAHPLHQISNTELFYLPGDEIKTRSALPPLFLSGQHKTVIHL